MPLANLLSNGLNNAWINAKHRIAWVLFTRGCKIGLLLLQNDLLPVAAFLRQRTSIHFSNTAMNIVVQTIWQKRRQFCSRDQILNYATRCALLLMEHELDRQEFFSRILAFAWHHHYRTRARIFRKDQVPEFIVILSGRYDAKEISQQIEVSEKYALRLMQCSFTRIRTALEDDAEFIKLWDQLTVELLKSSSEQAL